MEALTPKENEAILKIFKDFRESYNANSLSKVMDITPRGALKILKKLENKEILKSKKFGKASFYRINFKEDYTKKVLEYLLMTEARKKGVKRWLWEFRDIYKDAEIVLVFGSMTRNPKQAKDIDVLFVFKKEKFQRMKDFVKDKNIILLKPIHPVYQLPSDVRKNLKEESPALVSAIKTGYVLHGYDKIIKVMENVTSN
jgi:predicted nucleotidyltransferase